MNAKSCIFFSFPIFFIPSEKVRLLCACAAASFARPPLFFPTPLASAPMATGRFSVPLLFFSLLRSRRSLASDRTRGRLTHTNKRDKTEQQQEKIRDESRLWTGKGESESFQKSAQCAPNTDGRIHRGHVDEMQLVIGKKEQESKEPKQPREKKEETATHTRGAVALWISSFSREGRRRAMKNAEQREGPHVNNEKIEYSCGL